MSWTKRCDPSIRAFVASLILFHPLLLPAEDATSTPPVPVVEKNTPPESTADPAPPGQTLTLAECIRTALRQNTDILKSREEIHRIDGYIVEVSAQALPSLSINTSFNGEDTQFATIPNIPAFPYNNDATAQTWWSSGVRLRQLIYNGGAVVSAIQASHIGQSIAFHQLRATIDRVLFDTRKSFYTVLLNRSLISVREESITLLQEELEQQRHREAVGAGTSFNTLRAEVELANAQPPLIRARNNLRISLAELSRILGIDYTGLDNALPPFDIRGTLDSIPINYSFHEALAAAMKNRPDLMVATSDVELQKKNVAINRAGYMPTVSAFTGYDFRSDRFVNKLGRVEDGWTTGVEGSWSLFDGFLTKGKVEQANAQLTTSILNADAVRRQIQVEVRQAFSDYQEAQELITSQTKNVDRARESLRMAKARVEAGAGTQLDILNARVALTEGQTNELQARYDFIVAVANIERVTGKPVEQLAETPTP